MMDGEDVGSALTHSDYTVGWICALPKELVAATAILDERHPDLRKPASDINAYTLGSIGGHNVALCCLPKGMIGNVPAATIASHLVTTFPSIKLGLLVGIGGGVPSNKVRLGDVVVSTASGPFPGVVKWDSGKAHESGKFERTGSLNNPPKALLTALSKLITQHGLVGSAIPQYLEEVKERWPRLAAKAMRSESLKDVLFKATYSHVIKPNDEGDEDKDEDEEEQESCHLCDRSMIVKRKPREMLIHYGLIASGDKLIKDAATRNQLNKDLGGHVLCIEMEAAGIMNDLPCLVVRGICDYADSHKNKDWQEHAALVAAAFTKELLQYVQASDVETERPMKELVEIVQSIKSTVSKTHEDLGQVKFEQTRIRENIILQWLTTLEYGLEQSKILSLRQSGTGNWFFDRKEFKDWISESKRTLFCEGIPGAGKTILTSIVIDHLTSKYQDDPSIGVAYGFCNFQRQNDQIVDQLLASLLKQLAGKLPLLPQHVVALYDKHERGRTRPGTKEIIHAIEKTVSEFSQVFILIDALDEYGTAGSSRNQFLRHLGQLQQQFELNVFTTSRFDSSISSQIEKAFEGLIRMEIRADKEDIETYVKDKLGVLPPTVHENPHLRADIRTGIADSVHGMFLLAQVYINLLRDQNSETEIRLQLEAFANRKGAGEDGKIAALSVAYKETMERIKQQHSKHANLAKQVLLWLTYARRELTVEELQHALATSSLQRHVSHADLPYHERLVGVCAGLVTIDKARNIISLVHYTIQEYLDKNPGELYPLSERDISMSCLTYLSINTAQHYNAASELSSLLHCPSYQYAAKHWGHHALQSSVPDDELISFFNENPSVANSFGSTSMTEDFLEETGRATMLHFAAYFGLASLTSTLLESGVEVDGCISSMKTSLSNTEELGNIKFLFSSWRLRSDANLFLSKDGQLLVRRTPLSYAAERGHTTTTQILLEGKANPNLDISGTPEESYKPLSCAVRNGHEDVVRILLEWGARGIQLDFLQAAELGYEAVVRVLVEGGAELNYQHSHSNGDFKRFFGRTAISLTTENGHESLVRYLVKMGADSTLGDRKGRTPLLLAAGTGNQVVFDLLFEAGGCKLDSADYEGDTPLCYATMSGNESMVNLLLDRGFDLDPKLESGGEPLEGCTPLWYAAKGGHTSIVQLLLAKGANPNSPTQRTSWHQGRTPLFVAAQQGYEAVVRILLGKGAYVNTEVEHGDDIGTTPLSFACCGRLNEDVAELMLQCGANPEPSGSTWNSNTAPFPLAARKGLQRIEKMLLEAGVTRIDQPDDEGRTPLSYMAEHGHTDNVRFLLERGADASPEWRYRNQRTPRSFAAENNHESVVMLLIEYGANCRSKSIILSSPLLLASKRGSSHIFQTLLSHYNLDPECSDSKGWTPLHHAAAGGHLAIVKLLIGRGVDLELMNCYSNGCQTPLLVAIMGGQEEIVRLLVESGAHINGGNYHRRTPLSIAAEYGHKNILRLLIEKGAHVNCQDWKGKTPLAYAVQREHKDSARLLVRAGADIHFEDWDGKTPLGLATAYPLIFKALLEEEQERLMSKRRTLEIQ
ncbi:hypothetical protein NW768_007557 [Fusarium equiseti]|uniref:Nucleoside phosphorylase domain-containing protein n=1 Tax=Fusarium equiseti TaxID=61235 RepID=A0ABQ8R833_FUSEQ|nr:hypothetical protein NW768_007557 [Fusarium equiseti]